MARRGCAIEGQSHRRCWHRNQRPRRQTASTTTPCSSSGRQSDAIRPFAGQGMSVGAAVMAHGVEDDAPDDLHEVAHDLRGRQEAEPGRHRHHPPIAARSQLDRKFPPDLLVEPLRRRGQRPPPQWRDLPRGAHGVAGISPRPSGTRPRHCARCVTGGSHLRTVTSVALPMLRIWDGSSRDMSVVATRRRSHPDQSLVGAGRDEHTVRAGLGADTGHPPHSLVSASLLPARAPPVWSQLSVGVSGWSAVGTVKFRTLSRQRRAT